MRILASRVSALQRSQRKLVALPALKDHQCKSIETVFLSAVVIPNSYIVISTSFGRRCEACLGRNQCVDR